VQQHTCFSLYKRCDLGEKRLQNGELHLLAQGLVGGGGMVCNNMGGEGGCMLAGKAAAGRLVVP